jgi:ABC-2 type transport system permease protein
MRSITGSASVIKKVRVPKYIYPLANVISNFITFLISLLVLVGFCVFYFLLQKNPPHLTRYLLLAPVPLLILFLLCIGVGLVLSTLSVFFKDVEYLYDVFCMLLFYATPIFYTTKQLKGNSTMNLMLMANPLYSIVEMFRDCVLRGQLLNPHHLLYSLGFALFMVFLGGVLFYKQQDRFILYI